MAGFREFVTGEVLTAANVDDYLAKQAVMKFADSAARDTALGTAVGGSNALREGMVAWLDDTDDLLKYDGTSWATVGNAGIGSNVVVETNSTSFSTTSGTYVPVTPLAVSITPSTDTSKILVLASFAMSNSANTSESKCAIARGGTVIQDGTSGMGGFWYYNMSNANNTAPNMSLMLLDSPSTTSSTTYQVHVKGGGTTYVNRNGNSVGPDIFSGTIMAIEVAA